MLPKRPCGGAAASLSSRLAFRPRLVPLEGREVPSTTETGEPPPPPIVVTPPPAVVAPPILAVGSDVGNKPGVRVYDTATGQVKFSFLAYEPAFKGGVRVATGDVTGDGVPDVVVAPGPGHKPLVKVYDGIDGTLLTQFMAYTEKITGGFYVAVGDTNGDGQADVITGAGEKGGPHVKVFNGAWVEPPIIALVQQATSSTSLTVNADGTTTTGTTTTPPTLRDTQTQVLMEFMAYDLKFIGGVRVAAGDVNGDGKVDIVTAAGIGGGPHVKVYSGADGSVLRSFLAFGSTFTGGIYVSAGDLDADGKADLVVATGPKGGAQVRVFGGATGVQQREFGALNAAGNLGAKVAVADYDQDGSADILVAVGRQVQVRNGRTGKLKTTLNVSDANFANGINI